MKFGKFTPAVLLCTALLLSGCSGKQAASSTMASGNSDAFSSETANISVSSAPQGADSALSSLPGAGKGKNTSSSASENVSQNGPLKTISTDNNKFNNKFKSNPLDKAYLSEINSASTTLQMVNISSKYAALWEKEVSYAYAALKAALKSDSAKLKTAGDEQEKWENGKAAALAKINSDAQVKGGSMARVEAASDTMDFYRDRAAALYRQLYDYDKNYSYAYH
jgi:major membrane immunogen (membrane-anchored lipoprotein)